jgi:hypothetical protein
MSYSLEQFFFTALKWIDRQHPHVSKTARRRALGGFSKSDFAAAISYVISCLQSWM